MRTLAELVEDLGPSTVVATVGDLGRELTSVTVDDPVHPRPATPGCLLLGVGHTPESALALLRRAGSGGSVLLKGTTLPEVDEDGPAVLLVDPEADWGHVISLARLSVSAAAVEGAPVDDSLFSLAEALAALCSGSVVIHDPSWQLLAYSGGDARDAVRTETLLGRRAPAEPLERLRDAGVVDRLLKGELVHLRSGEIQGLTERFAAAVLLNGQFLGTIWVTPTGDVDEAQALDGLRRAADVAALSLLRRATLAVRATVEHELSFADLLRGAQTERLVAQRLGVPVDAGFVLAGLRPLASDPTERAGTAQRLLTLARSYGEAYRVTALAAADREIVFLVFPCAGAEERHTAVRVLTDLHGRLQRSAPHRALISSTYPHLADTPRVRTTVEELLELAERRGWSGLTDSEQVQASWRLAQFREVALAHPALLEGPGMRLVEHDRVHGGGLLETLRAYFAAVGDVKAAAEVLGLHYNTVRYRLRRAQEVSDLDLDDPDQRLLAELQVRLLSD